MAQDPNAPPDVDYDNISKSTTLKLIKEGKIITKRKSKKFTSKMWNHIYLLERLDTKEIIKQWVQCQDCGAILSGKTGTGTLQQHLESSICAKVDGKQTSLIKEERKVDANDKKRLILILGQMCAIDLTPFDLVQRHGFKQVLQLVWELGAKYGKISKIQFENVIPHNSTVSRNESLLRSDAAVEISYVSVFMMILFVFRVFPMKTFFRIFWFAILLIFCLQIC